MSKMRRKIDLIPDASPPANRDHKATLPSQKLDPIYKGGRYRNELTHHVSKDWIISPTINLI